MASPLDRLLVAARERGASDVHVSVDEPPLLRVGGVLERMEGVRPLTGPQIAGSVQGLLDARRAQILKACGQVDFCHEIEGQGRYRANAYVQRKGLCAAFRVIPITPPSFRELGLPEQLRRIVEHHQGLVVISGPAGSGKSTSLSALVHQFNETRACHVITVEDPIEFVHPERTALIHQREVGRHAPTFSRALRSALREDPDVVVVGELRDLETIRMALTAAETGHLVMATMHTTSAPAVVERLVKAFPPEERPQVRMSLSESLQWVVSQSLVPSTRGGCAAAFEILRGSSPVRALIRDGKTTQLESMMQIGSRFGMQTRDQALQELVRMGLVAPATAQARTRRRAR